MKSRKQVLKKLFLSTLYLSAFTFGGGYVIVTQHSWLSLQEFADLVAMAAIFAVCLVLLRKTKLSPILVMLLAGAVNLLLPAQPDGCPGGCASFLLYGLQPFFGGRRRRSRYPMSPSTSTIPAAITSAQSKICGPAMKISVGPSAPPITPTDAKPRRFVTVFRSPASSASTAAPRQTNRSGLLRNA